MKRNSLECIICKTDLQYDNMTSVGKVNYRGAAAPQKNNLARLLVINIGNDPRLNIFRTDAECYGGGGCKAPSESFIGFFFYLF